MDYEFRIDTSNRIMHQIFRGPCTLRDMENGLEELSGARGYDPDFNLLSDLRECKLEVRPEELEGFALFFKGKLGSAHGKSAIILDTPLETALSMIHREIVAPVRRVELFSTYEAALDWLLGVS